MYCLDSHGTDIEHYWPKTPYPDKMFVWPNLLLCCTECGRLKGSSFPLAAGAPLLIDPTAENPWEHVDFDTITGNLTAKFTQEGVEDPKGRETVALLRLNRREALAIGYRRTWRRLSGIVRTYMDRTAVRSQLVEDLVEADDHGLLGWCIHGGGRDEPLFDLLRHQHPEVWRRLAERVR